MRHYLRHMVDYGLVTSFLRWRIAGCHYATSYCHHCWYVISERCCHNRWSQCHVTRVITITPLRCRHYTPLPHIIEDYAEMMHLPMSFIQHTYVVWAMPLFMRQDAMREGCRCLLRTKSQRRYDDGYACLRVEERMLLHLPAFVVTERRGDAICETHSWLLMSVTRSEMATEIMASLLCLLASGYGAARLALWSYAKGGADADRLRHDYEPQRITVSLRWMLRHIVALERTLSVMEAEKSLAFTRCCVYDITFVVTAMLLWYEWHCLRERRRAMFYVDAAPWADIIWLRALDVIASGDDDTPAHAILKKTSYIDVIWRWLVIIGYQALLHVVVLRLRDIDTPYEALMSYAATHCRLLLTNTPLRHIMPLVILLLMRRYQYHSAMLR